MTTQLLQMYKMGRTRLTNQIPNISEADLTKKLHVNSNSIGFLLQHIAEVELLFSRNVFGADIKVTVHTIGKGISDSGKFVHYDELIDGLNHSESELEKIIIAHQDNEWANEITTAEFGTITKAEALARIISHTAYHAGQIGLIKKYAE